MRFISIDVETTGLEACSDQLIEVAAIFVDTDIKCPMRDRPTFHELIKHRVYRLTHFTLEMHKDKWKEIDTLGISPVEFNEKWIDWIANMMEHVPDGFKQLPKPWVAGKNFSFDEKFLTKACPAVKYKHRVMDPTMLYMLPTDQEPPDLKTCCERAGITANFHCAYDDAAAVVELILRKLWP